MNECRYCTHYRAAWTSPRGVQVRCTQGQTVKSGKHDCPKFEREPGADDDLGGIS